MLSSRRPISLFFLPTFFFFSEFRGRSRSGCCEFRVHGVSSRRWVPLPASCLQRPPFLGSSSVPVFTNFNYPFPRRLHFFPSCRGLTHADDACRHVICFGRCSWRLLRACHFLLFCFDSAFAIAPVCRTAWRCSFPLIPSLVVLTAMAKRETVVDVSGDGFTATATGFCALCLGCIFLVSFLQKKHLEDGLCG